MGEAGGWHSFWTRGVVKMYTDNDACLYQLTGDEPRRQMVLDLAETDWLQGQMVLEDRYRPQ